jgi:hypothetical protein
MEFLYSVTQGDVKKMLMEINFSLTIERGNLPEKFVFFSQLSMAVILFCSLFALPLIAFTLFQPS